MKFERRLALVWGRKFFFSYGLVSLFLIGPLFFQHQSLPTGALDWIYVILSFIGHFGVLLSLGFFVLYVPLVWVLPGYYWARFWASTILTSLLGLVTLDAIVVSQYRFHFYELIQLRNNLSIDQLLDSLNIQSALIGALVMLWIFLFVIGEKLWRHLQRRFSQTVSNWYIYPIVICFILSHMILLFSDNKNYQRLSFYGDSFPFQISKSIRSLASQIGMKDRENLKETPKSVFYPKEKLVCNEKMTKNLLVILVPGWRNENFNLEGTELLWHYAEHGQRFDQQFMPAASVKEGLFNFFYALPTFYLKDFEQTQTHSAFLNLIKNSNMKGHLLSVNQDISLLSGQISSEKLTSNAALLEAFKVQMANLEEATPFASFNIVDGQNSASLTATVQALIEELINKKKRKETNIIVASLNSDESRVPMFTLFPNREDQVVSHFSQLSDVVPSLMKEQFKCKNDFSVYSLGQSLWNDQDKSIVYKGDEKNLSILNYDVKNKSLVEVGGQEFFKEFKKLLFFYKRSR